MSLKVEDLKSVAEKGSKDAAKAFSVLSGTEAKVSVSKIDEIDFDSFTKKISKGEDHTIVSYTQALKGEEMSGVVLLALPRESALTLVDLLNKQEVGEAGILKDIDRSAIKETLNILSNSYINALDEKTSIDLKINVPRMITMSRIDPVVSDVVKLNPKGGKILVFETELLIDKYEIKASLFLVFTKEIVED